MEFVNPVNVAVILVGLEIFAINYLATPDAQNMVNAKMALVFALKDGMADIVHCVSAKI